MKPHLIAAIDGILFITGLGTGIISGSLVRPILSTPDYLHQIAAHESQWIVGSLMMLVVMGLPLAMVPVEVAPSRQSMAWDKL